MKADTNNYIHLQKLYKTRAEEEKQLLRRILQKAPGGDEGIDETLLDTFVRNAHGLRLLRGEPWGALDRDVDRLSGFDTPKSDEFFPDHTYIEEQLTSKPRETAIHLAFYALEQVISRRGGEASVTGFEVTSEELTNEVVKLLGGDTELPEEVDQMIGEM